MHHLWDLSAGLNSKMLACFLQMAAQYELQLTESRLAETKLRATCRRLESEGMFAEVFDTYEREIASLQVS